MTWNKKRHEELLRATKDERVVDALGFTRRLAEANERAIAYATGENVTAAEYHANYLARLALLREWEGEDT